MEKHFPVLFSGNMAQLMNFMWLLIFPLKRGGKAARHPRSSDHPEPELRDRCS